MKPLKNNKNIFQICINLNDDIPELQAHKQNLIKRNPKYQYHYITSNRQMFDLMEDAFANSKDELDQKIYESFLLVERKLNTLKKREIKVLVSRTDIFRYAMTYKYGGFYLDLSSESDVDIDNDLSRYDFYAIGAGADSSGLVHSSFVYGKRGNTICRLVLEEITSACNIDTRDMSLNQCKYAGPPCLARVLDSINIDEHNGKVEHQSVCSFFKMKARWKADLHKPDKNNPNKKINRHWLFSDERLQG